MSRRRGLPRGEENHEGFTQRRERVTAEGWTETNVVFLEKIVDGQRGVLQSIGTHALDTSGKERHRG